MFYVFMVIDLILIGASFFLWFQLNQEGFVMAGVSAVAVNEKPVRTPNPVNNAKSKKEKKKKAKKGKNIDDEFEENVTWDNFGIVERNKGVVEEQREMDEMFGFESRKDDGLLEKARNNEPTPKKDRSIEEEFGDLFSDDEKKEISSTFEPQLNTTSKTNSFDNFSDFENFKIGDEETNGDSPDDGAYDFLKNYDFSTEDKENIDDDIFERARNQKLENPKKENKQEDDWDFKNLKNDFPPIERVNYEQPNKGNVSDDEDDDIFARLQRLSNMMDQQKK